MSVLLAGGLLEAGSQCQTEAGEGCNKRRQKNPTALHHKKSLNLLD
jgi:hypothetical protein